MFPEILLQYNLKYLQCWHSILKYKFYPKHLLMWDSWCWLRQEVTAVSSTPFMMQEAKLEASEQYALRTKKSWRYLEAWTLTLAQCHFYHILFVKTNHMCSPESKVAQPEIQVTLRFFTQSPIFSMLEYRRLVAMNLPLGIPAHYVIMSTLIN